MSPGEHYHYNCPSDNCDKHFDRPAKLTAHAATDHPELLGKVIRFFTAQLQPSTRTVKFQNFRGPHEVKQAQRSTGKRQASTAARDVLPRKTRTKAAKAHQQPAKYSTTQQLPGSTTVLVEEIRKQHAMELELVKAQSRADLAEASLKSAREKETQQEKLLATETAFRIEAQQSRATADRNLEQVIANNNLLAENNKTIATSHLIGNNHLLTHVGPTPTILAQRNKSAARQEITRRH